MVFLNSPHPLEILKDRAAYGTGGTIQRDHDMNSYLKAVRSAIRHEVHRVRKAKREHHRKIWWPPPAPPPELEEVAITAVEDEQNDNENSAAIASAAAAVEVEREATPIASASRFAGKSKEEVAAIRIQTAFRGYLVLSCFVNCIVGFLLYL
ncbi:hypothetical protein ACFE04_021842 [Oxalis oulophora]